MMASSSRYEVGKNMTLDLEEEESEVMEAPNYSSERNKEGHILKRPSLQLNRPSQNLFKHPNTTRN